MGRSDRLGSVQSDPEFVGDPHSNRSDAGQGERASAAGDSRRGLHRQDREAVVGRARRGDHVNPNRAVRQYLGMPVKRLVYPGDPDPIRDPGGGQVDLEAEQAAMMDPPGNLALQPRRRVCQQQPSPDLGRYLGSGLAKDKLGDRSRLSALEDEKPRVVRLAGGRCNPPTAALAAFFQGPARVETN